MRSNKIKILKKAKELISKHPQGVCVAISSAYIIILENDQDFEYDEFILSQFQLIFSPQPFATDGYYWGWPYNSESQELRLMALDFMIEMIKTGDI
jgi:hypothetical protein